MKFFKLFLLFFTLNAWATTFVPIPLKQMIKSSTAMVSGEVLFSRSEYLQANEIVTITSIQLDKWAGIEGKKIVEVYSPGGSVDNEVSLIEGAPKFREGEKVFLFLKEHNSHLWVSNLSLGTYRYKKLGSKNMLVNSVFPYHHEIGQISPEKLFELAHSVKNIKFKSRFRDKYQVMREHNQRSGQNINRKIASTEFSEETPKDNYNIYWLLAALGVLGALWTLKKQRE